MSISSNNYERLPPMYTRHCSALSVQTIIDVCCNPPFQVVRHHASSILCLPLESLPLVNLSPLPIFLVADCSTIGLPFCIEISAHRDFLLVDHHTASIEPVA